MRFPGLDMEDAVPDAKTVWMYRERLAQAGAIKPLFNSFARYLKAQGYCAMGGRIIDASLVLAPRQRNKRTENERIKAGAVPEDWAKTPAKARRKDTDAQWRQKNGVSHCGYQNHVSVDHRHKLVI